MKKLIQKLKDCEGCKRRRSFLKGMLMAVAGFFMLPKEAQAQNGCCTYCPNAHNWICLQCDSDCTRCHYSCGGECATVTEYCGGQLTIYSSCCTPLQLKQNANESSRVLGWKIEFDDQSTVTLTVTNPPDNFDPMEFCKSGRLKVKSDDGTERKAMKATKF